MGCPSGYTASPTPPLNNGVHTTLIRQKSGGGDITGPMARFAHISRPQCRIPSANSRRRRRQLVLARRSERRSRRFRRTFSSALDAGRSNQSKRRKRAELSPAETDAARRRARQSIREYELIWLLQQRVRAVSWPHCTLALALHAAATLHGHGMGVVRP